MTDQTDTSRPLITVGIPLYKSNRFLDPLIANIEAIDEENIEFLFSDQHCYDDSADRIRSHFADDPRVRVITSNSKICWSENYNLLLKESRGVYFRWLAHDDELPVNGMAKQIELLKQNSDAVCILGNIRRIDLDGNPYPLIGREKIRPVPTSKPWSVWHSLFIFANRRYAGGIKALWKRDVLVDNNLFIRPTLDHNQPERVYLFGASLYGRFLYDDDYDYLKRMYPESTSAQWRTTWRNDLSYLSVGLRYLANARGPIATFLLFPAMVGIALVYRPLIRHRRNWRRSRSNIR